MVVDFELFPVFLLLLFPVITAATKDVGGKLNCPQSVFGRSPTTPTNVNQIRFADIDLIGALGDSLTVNVNQEASPLRLALAPKQRSSTTLPRTAASPMPWEQKSTFAHTSLWPVREAAK